MTQQEKEQRLRDLASKVAEIYERGTITKAERAELLIVFAMSNSVKEYWQSQQKQETPELEEIRTMVRKSVNEHLVKHKDVGDDRRCRVDIMIDEIANNIAPYIKGTEWVSVKDAKAIQGKSYWLCIKLGNTRRVKLGVYHVGSWMSNGHDWTEQVTHVMEYLVPKAPKEVNDGQ